MIEQVRRRSRCALPVMVLAGALATLAGWLLGIEPLVRVRQEWPVTVPTTALALAVVAGVLVACCRTGGPPGRVGRVAAAAVATLGAASLAHHLGLTPWVTLDGGLLSDVAAWQPGVDHPARPPLLTSLQLVALGTFLALEPTRGRAGRLTLWGLATVAVAGVTVQLVGYLGGDPEVLQPGTRLSLPAAAMVAAAWTATLRLALPRLTADHPGWFGPSTRTLLRRIGPPLVLLAPLVGGLRLVAERTAWMDPTTTLATASVLLAIGAAGFVLTTGRSLDLAQAERRRGEALLRGVVESLEEGLVVRDRTGALLLSNPAMEDLTGLPYASGAPAADDVARRTVYRHPDGSPDELPSARAARDGVPILGEVGRLTRADGTTRWVRSNALGFRTLAGGAAEFSVTTITDVTEEQRTVQALADAERRFRLMFEQAPIGLASVTPDGRFEAVNDAFCELVGRRPDELLGETFQAITHPDDLDADEGLLADLAADRITSYQLDKRYLRPDGTEVWVSLHVGVLRDDAGDPHRYLAQVVDLSDRKRLERLLADAASHDALTGLPNRRLLDERLDDLRRRSQRHPERHAALLFIDLDGFKTINDLHGHDVGDALLAALADRLDEVVRAGETVARFGGDEFVVLVEDAATDDLAALCDRLEVALHGPVTIGDTTVWPAASIGIHRYAPATVTPQEALRAADARMYVAKRARRSRDDLDPGPAAGDVDGAASVSGADA